jgi:hypothetical protein
MPTRRAGRLRQRERSIWRRDFFRNSTGLSSESRRRRTRCRCRSIGGPRPFVVFGLATRSRGHGNTPGSSLPRGSGDSRPRSCRSRCTCRSTAPRSTSGRRSSSAVRDAPSDRPVAVCHSGEDTRDLVDSPDVGDIQGRVCIRGLACIRGRACSQVGVRIQDAADIQGLRSGPSVARRPLLGLRRDPSGGLHRPSVRRRHRRWHGHHRRPH